MVQTKKRTVEEELHYIVQKHKGIIRPIDIVEFARDPDTALHSRFEWDDTEAAHAYRLWQARQVLRVYVTIELPDISKMLDVRTYVSLPEDRKAEGGYRRLVDVMQDDDLRASLLNSAKADLRIFRRKYSDLAELGEVHVAIDKLIT